MKWKNKTLLKRFLALVFDRILFYHFGPIGLLLIAITFNSEIKIIIPLLICYILYYFYAVLMHRYLGKTIGKLILNLKVTDLSGKNPSLLRALVREALPLMANILLIISMFGGYNNFYQMMFRMIILCWFLAEIISMSLTETNRSLHDLVAGTIVIRDEKVVKQKENDDHSKIVL